MPVAGPLSQPPPPPPKTDQGSILVSHRPGQVSQLHFNLSEITASCESKEAWAPLGLQGVHVDMGTSDHPYTETESPPFFPQRQR